MTFALDERAQCKLMFRIMTSAVETRAFETQPHCSALDSQPLCARKRQAWCSVAAATVVNATCPMQVKTNPVWFQGLVWQEVIVQIPLIVALLYGYATCARWVRLIGAVYAVHVLTTMPPILLHFEATMKPPHKWCVYGFYGPFAAMPALMLLRYALGSPFAAPKRARSSNEGSSRRKST